MSMPSDQRSPGEDIIHIAIAIHIKEIGFSPRSINNGLPPTARKAHHGKLTPPGKSVLACANKDSDFVVFILLAQPTCRFLGMIGDDQICASAFDTGKDFKCHSAFIEPAVGCGSLIIEYSPLTLYATKGSSGCPRVRGATRRDKAVQV